MVTVGFPLFYIVWGMWFVQPYENLWLRILGSVIFLPLLFYKRWPVKWLHLLPHYWAFTILYGPCFFFAFMLIKNDFNLVWSMSAMAGAVLLVFVSYDFLMLFTLYLIGVMAAWICVILTGDVITSERLIAYAEQLPIYGFIFGFGVVFNQAKERILQEKHQTALEIGGTIAHEIRTPLISIRSAADGLKQHLPTLLSAYQIAREEKRINRIHPGQYRQLAKIPESIFREVDYSNTIIDMLLFNSNHDYLDNSTFQYHSVSRCLDETLGNYPFKENKERDLISVKITDFSFWGNDLYLRNVLFNLINNALYFIAESGKGTVEIISDEDRHYWYLYFKDTGKGIPPDFIKEIFDPFYTNGKNGGTGIGLSFCKQVMNAFKGDISCRSNYGEFTEFKLRFPKVISK